MNKAESMGVDTKRPSGVRVRAKLAGQAVIDALRTAVAEKSYANINGTTVDLFSASAVIAIFDRVNEANKEKLKAMPIHRMVSVCFATLNKHQ